VFISEPNGDPEFAAQRADVRPQSGHAHAVQLSLQYAVEFDRSNLLALRQLLELDIRILSALGEFVAELRGEQAAFVCCDLLVV
jgi:hypothetical protein